jgi:hypothetical protein
MVAIVAKLILDEKHNNNTACHSKCQAKNIDKRVNLISFEISPGDF